MLKVEDDARKAKDAQASSTIQSSIKGKLERDKAKSDAEKAEAANLIQGAVKGEMSNRELQEMIFKFKQVRHCLLFVFFSFVF